VKVLAAPSGKGIVVATTLAPTEVETPAAVVTPIKLRFTAPVPVRATTGFGTRIGVS